MQHRRAENELRGPVDVYRSSTSIASAQVHQTTLRQPFFLCEM